MNNLSIELKEISIEGREMRKNENVGVKTAALISDTLQEKFGIDNWFSKEKEK